MSADIGLDAAIGRVEAVGETAVGFADDVTAVLSGLRSDRNAFGGAALLDAGDAPGDVPVLDNAGRIPQSAIPAALVPGGAFGLTVLSRGAALGDESTVTGLDFAGAGLSVSRTGAVATVSLAASEETLLEHTFAAPLPGDLKAAAGYELAAAQALSREPAEADDARQLLLSIAVGASAASADSSPRSPEIAIRAGDWRAAPRLQSPSLGDSLAAFPCATTAGGSAVVGLFRGPSGRPGLIGTSTAGLHLAYIRVRLV